MIESYQFTSKFGSAKKGTLLTEEEYDKLKQKDAALQGAVTTEAAARENADADLQDQINRLKNLGFRVGVVDDYTGLPATETAALALFGVSPNVNDYAWVRHDTSPEAAAAGFAGDKTMWGVLEIGTDGALTWEFLDGVTQQDDEPDEITLHRDPATGVWKVSDAYDATLVKLIDFANLQGIPTTLQTTDPPTYVVARLTITDGGAGYAVGNQVIIRTPDLLGAPEVHAAVTAVDDEGGVTTGAITALDFDVTTVYAEDPSGPGKEVIGGDGTGAVVSVRTAYAPGDTQTDGMLMFVPLGDPLVQSSRMRGFVKEYLLDSEVSLQVRRLEAMRKWSPDYLYSESEVTFLDAWFVPNPDDMPVFGQSPLTDPQKWVKVGGLDDQALVEIAKLKAIVEMLKAEVFGGTVTFNNHFVLDFYTMDGVNLEEGVWNVAQGRIEV